MATAPKRVRADFAGGPADGQWRVFADPPPATINWMTADGPYVYTGTESAGKYIYTGSED